MILYELFGDEQPDLMQRDRDEYIRHLRAADSAQAQGSEDPLEGLRTFISRLLAEQVGDA